MHFTIDHMIAICIMGIVIGMWLGFKLKKYPANRKIERMHPMDAYYAGFDQGVASEKRMRKERR